MKNRIFFISDVIIILLLLGMTTNTLLSTYIHKRILEEIPRDKFQTSIDRFRINIFSGYICAEIIKLKSKDTNIEANLNRISVSDFSILKFIFHRQLLIDKIEFIKGNVIFKKSSESNKSFGEDFGYALSKNGIDETAIKSIELTDVTVDISGSSKPIFSCSNSHASVYNINVKKDTDLKIDSISAEINNSILVSKDSFYTMQVNRIKILPGQKKISIAGINITPNYDKKVFSRKLGQQTDRFDINIKSAEINEFNLIHFLLNDTLLAGEMSVDSANINIYRDKYFEFNNSKKRMLQSIIKDLPIALQIRKCRINNSMLTYSELNPPASEPGNISLTKIEAIVENVSNIDSTDMTISSVCSLNNKAPLSVMISFPKNSVEFNIDGNIKNLEMKNFSSLLESTSSLTITNGVIDSMRFNFGLKNRTIDGTVLMQFHNFRVAAIDPDSKDTTGVIRNIKTEIANRLVLKSDNQNVPDELQSVNVSREYRENYFITNNIIKTILSGIQKSVVRK